MRTTRRVGSRSATVPRRCRKSGRTGNNISDLTRVQDAHDRRKCSDENGTESWACSDCDCTARLEQKLKATGTPFLDESAKSVAATLSTNSANANRARTKTPDNLFPPVLVCCCELLAIGSLLAALATLMCTLAAQSHPPENSPYQSPGTRKMAALLEQIYREQDWKTDPNKADERVVVSVTTWTAIPACAMSLRSARYWRRTC